ncbi:MAG: response regulator [Pseudomonadota bacterium]
MSLNLAELTVLIVEPSSTQRKGLKRWLLQSGVSFVHEADDGQTALDMANAVKPDLILSSFYLPSLSGNELVEALNANPELTHTAFILVSSETRSEYLDEIKQSGVAAILGKPFTQRELDVALGTTLELLNPEEVEDGDFIVGNIEVLIVDDSRMARKHISRVLGGMGVQHITEAADGSEGFDEVNQHTFDLIITDYNMPGMNGAEFTRAVRTSSIQPDTPIMMITSEEDQDMLAAAESAGVSAICDKPFETRKIRHLVEQVLQH